MNSSHGNDGTYFDEDSRDSGISINEEESSTHCISFITGSQKFQQTEGIATMVSSGLNNELDDLKIEELCDDLTEGERETDALLRSKMILRKRSEARPILADVSNFRPYPSYDSLWETTEMHSSISQPHSSNNLSFSDDFATKKFMEDIDTLKCDFQKSRDFEMETYNREYFSRSPLISDSTLGHMETMKTSEMEISMSSFAENSNVFINDTTDPSCVKMVTPLSSSRFFRNRPESERVVFRRTQSSSESQNSSWCGDWINISSRRNSEGIMSSSSFHIHRSSRKREKAEDFWSFDVAEYGKKRKGLHSTLMREDVMFSVSQMKNAANEQKKLSFTRVQSSSIFELGEFSRVPSHVLPSDFEVEYSLPFVKSPQVVSGAFKSISAETLIKLMTTLSFDEFYAKFILVDCRYPYEYAGGHIRGAINVHDPVVLDEVFFPKNVDKLRDLSKRIPVFYCEFSQKRGPAMAQTLRAHDRKQNELLYPHVDYKEIYIIDYGYKQFYFFSKYKGLCEPDAYVSMHDSDHVNELKTFNFHRSKSACVLDCTISKERRQVRRRGKLNFSAASARSVMPLHTIFSSPREQDSPTQLNDSFSRIQRSNIISSNAEADSPVLTPLTKLNF